MSMLHRQFNKVFDNPNLDMTEALKLQAMIQIDIAEAQMRIANSLSEIVGAIRKNGGMPVDFDRLLANTQNMRSPLVRS
jgi:cell division GTPase FtsZ